MRRRAELRISSELAADPAAVWARATDPAGINDELRPLMRMTIPRGLPDFGLDDPEPGPIGRSWLLLFGFLPFDYDDIALVRIEPGRAFLERSSMLSMRLWEHERTLDPLGEDRCRITDRLAWEPRLPIPGALLRPLIHAIFSHRHRRLGRASRYASHPVPLATDFQQILDTLPPDWTDLEVDVRIDDESQYVDSAVALSQVNAQVYQHPHEDGWHWRLLVAHSFGHAAAAETVKGVLAKLDGEGVAGELRIAEVREGRSEVMQMWGRPESVREEFRQRRSL